MSGYDNETQDMAGVAVNEVISVRVAEMEQDPEWIEKALNEADCDFTDELMRLRVQAHITDVWGPLRAFECARVAQYLLKFAKAEIEGAYYTRRSQTADLFANRLSRDEE